MKRFGLFCFLLLLSACAGGGQKPVIENPYAERMQQLSRVGIEAMQREHWQSATLSFEKALQAAQLSNQPELEVRAWYNLGHLYIGKHDLSQGESAMRKSLDIARVHGLSVAAMRAQLALALVQQRMGMTDVWQAEMLSSGWPADVYLSMARLAQLQGHTDLAALTYMHVAEKSPSGRLGMIYRAEAWLGLALLADGKYEQDKVQQLTAQVLEVCATVGAPRLAAHALLLQARNLSDQSARRDALQRAWQMYQALQDRPGQLDSLRALLAEYEQSGEREQAAGWREKLRLIEGSKGQPDG